MSKHVTFGYVLILLAVITFTAFVLVLPTLIQTDRQVTNVVGNAGESADLVSSIKTQYVQDNTNLLRECFTSVFNAFPPNPSSKEILDTIHTPSESCSLLGEDVSPLYIQRSENRDICLEGSALPGMICSEMLAMAKE